MRSRILALVIIYCSGFSLIQAPLKSDNCPLKTSSKEESHMNYSETSQTLQIVIYQKILRLLWEMFETKIAACLLFLWNNFKLN